MTGEKMLRSIVVLIGLAFFMLIVSSTNAQRENQNCRASAIQEVDLPRSSGQLLYIRQTISSDYEVFTALLSTNEAFQSISQDFVSEAHLSPNGLWLTAIIVDDNNERTMITYDHFGVPIFFYQSGEDYSNIRTLQWLGNSEYLTIKLGPNNEMRAHSIVNPFTEAIQFVFPEIPAWLNPTVETDPLFPEEQSIFGYRFTISPSGRYALIDQRVDSIIYDLDTKAVLSVQNLEGIIWSPWSPSSDKALSVDIMDTDNSTIVQLYLYNIENDETDSLLELDLPISESVGFIGTSGWSFNERYLALVKWSGDPQQSIVNVLEISNGTLSPTCLRYISGSVPDFAWSRDSRYLALYGALEGETDRETGSVYIYDTLENQIYEVYEGFSDIVGWMASPENE
jgi:hypothetical protein